MVFNFSRPITVSAAAVLSIASCAALVLTATSPGFTADEPWILASAQFSDIVDVESDDAGGLWVLDVEKGRYPSQSHRLVRVDSKGRKTFTATTVSGSAADSEQLDRDGKGGVIIVGPFDGPVDEVIGVTSQGDEYSLASPCPYEQSVGDGSGGVWIQCANSSEFMHLTGAGGATSLDFATAAAAIRVDGAWLLAADSTGGFWAFLWESGGSWNEPHRFQLASVDREGVIHLDSRTYTGRGDSPDVAWNDDGSVRVGSEPRIISPGFTSVIEVPNDIGDIDADCGIGGPTLRCLIPFGLGSVEWLPETLKWRITSSHPDQLRPVTGRGIGGDSVIGSQHVWGRRGTWWKSDRQGRVATVKLRNSAPALWPAVDVTSAGTTWWQHKQTLYAVEKSRIPWKRLPGRVQTLEIASSQSTAQAALPRKTDQHRVLRWSSSDKAKCVVHRTHIQWRAGFCPLVARADGGRRWAPFRARFTLGR